jgi:hypothetical protein
MVAKRLMSNVDWKSVAVCNLPNLPIVGCPQFARYIGKPNKGCQSNGYPDDEQNKVTAKVTKAKSAYFLLSRVKCESFAL